MSTADMKRMIQINTGLNNNPIVSIQYEDKMAKKGLENLLKDAARQLRKMENKDVTAIAKAEAIEMILGDERASFTQDGVALPRDALCETLSFSIRNVNGTNIMVAPLQVDASARAGSY